MRLFSPLLALILVTRAFTGFAAEPVIEPAPIKTNAVIAPGPNDPTIAHLTARLLERSHYSQQPFNDEVSSKFLDKYLEALDGQRLHLLQSDIAEFEVYRNQLDDLTIGRSDGRADTTPACRIFMRFRDRVRERHAYVNQLLANEPFDFTTDERVTINRKDLPWPKDLTEARQLWRERLRYEMLQEKLNKKKPEEIVKMLTRRYNSTLRSYEELDGDDVLQIYLSALTHVYDPHSDYFGKAALENFSIGMRLSLFGIGAVLTSEDGYCKIKELTPEGPASKSKKLKPEDRIVAVGQGTNPPVDVIDMKLNKVVELIRGAKNTEVRLTVIPADAPDPSVRKQIVLIRDEIKLADQEAKSKLYEIPDAAGKTMRLGVIDLPSFYSDFDTARGKPERKSTTTDVAILLKKLKEVKVDGIILDLRRNGGGSLEEAINLTGLFIKEGTVVQVKDPDGGITRDNDTDPSVLYDGPLVVLTSRFSASASEILAGALQDYGRALLVGDETTHGKGTVQSLVNLGQYLRQPEGAKAVEPGALKVTIRKFYRASGDSTQLEGVKPNLVLPSVNNVADVGEKSLDNALKFDTVPPADFVKLDRVVPFVAELKKRSDARLKTDRDFSYILEDIEQYKKVKAEKTVSLNEEKRLQEKADAEARANARKKELAARAEPKETVYELPLKLASQPGLPAPMAKTNLVAAAGSKKGGNMIRGKGPTVVMTSTNRITTTVMTSTNLIAATNQTASIATEAKKSAKDDDEDSIEEGAPAQDATLVETRRILVDFVKLTTSANQLAAAKNSSADVR